MFKGQFKPFIEAIIKYLKLSGNQIRSNNTGTKHSTNFFSKNGNNKIVTDEIYSDIERSVQNLKQRGGLWNCDQNLSLNAK